MTNHLLDYAEMFKSFVPKLRSKISLPETDLSNFRTKEQVKPLLSVVCNNMSLANRVQKVQVTNEENSNANEIKFAASEVAKALRELMEVVR